MVDEVGWAPPGEEAPLRFDVPIGTRLRLMGRGPALFAEDQRVLQASPRRPERVRCAAAQREGARGSDLAAADPQRTALLAAVGHDLRTPLAGIKAAVSTLRQTDVDWSPEETDELLATIEHRPTGSTRSWQPARRQPPAGRRLSVQPGRSRSTRRSAQPCWPSQAPRSG